MIDCYLGFENLMNQRYPRLVVYFLIRCTRFCCQTNHSYATPSGFAPINYIVIILYVFLTDKT